MKEAVSSELSREGYAIFFEPRHAPSRFMTWVSYRPDVFGIRAPAGRQEYALVECETHPSTTKLASKNFLTVEVQARLNSDLGLRRIVVVPRGRLRSLDSSVRRYWETWTYDGVGLQKFQSATGAPG